LLPPSSGGSGSGIQIAKPPMSFREGDEGTAFISFHHVYSAMEEHTVTIADAAII
jgi:hypothetical protein